MEAALGNIFLSQAFAIPKQDFLTPRLVDLSCLNCFIHPSWFRILMNAQVGAWFITLSLGNAYWNFPIDIRYRCFLAIQMGETVL